MFLIGNGLDIHNLKKKKNYLQKIGGLEFDLGYEVIATSDGDILLHAISNAILGALSLNDIGSYFSDKNGKTNLDSLQIIQFTLEEMKKRKYKINNLDITIVCQNIYFAKIKDQIVKNLKIILDCEDIGLKATRWEKRSNQIQSLVSVLLIK